MLSFMEKPTVFSEVYVSDTNNCASDGVRQLKEYMQKIVKIMLSVGDSD